MLKYVDTLVSFQEVPDEISLCINISNCPCKCEGCHSSYLAENIGEYLTLECLGELVLNNKGITCIAFLGGDSDPKEIDDLAKWIRVFHPTLKVAWYSGRQEISDYINLKNFDYIKVGPYIEEKGALSSRTTNQVMYKLDHLNEDLITDITYKFWK